jgi:DNA polymerase III delta subunit
MNLIPMGTKYIIAGSAYFINKKTSELTAEFEKGCNVEVYKIYADETNKAELSDLLFSTTLFSDLRVVILQRAELVGTSEVEKFFSVFAKAADTAVLILTEKISAVKAISKVLPDYKIVSEEKPAFGALSEEIEKIFDVNGLKIGRQSAYAIGEKCGWDFFMINMEAEKLSLYFHGVSGAKDFEILYLVTGERYETIWKFIDSFLERNRVKTMKALVLLEDTEQSSSIIFAMLIYYFGWLYFKTEYPNIAAEKLPIFKEKKYLQRIGRSPVWDEKSVAETISELRRLDYDIKTGSVGNYTDALIQLIAVL